MVIGNAAVVCRRAMRSRAPMPTAEEPFVESHLDDAELVTL